MHSTDDMPTVAPFDVARYLGTWFEICRLPLRFEEQGARDITASYSLNADGTIRVDNRCRDAEGRATQALGVAQQAQADHPARLEVSFLPAGLRWLPFTKGEYWVLKLDPAYQLSLVGEPGRKHLWLLSRQPQISMQQQQPYLDHARDLGFDLGPLIIPLQTGVPVSDAELAAVEAS